jgi:hypothetical protein
MPWYVAECLYYADTNPTAREQLGEYRYFLVEASNDEAAIIKSWQLGRNREHSYVSADETEVKWLLESVVDVKEILDETLSEGTELYHKYIERHVAEAAVKATLDI